MARVTPVSGSEPLMKLERPTSGCSQSTAHLINAAFTDVLSAKPHDAKAVGNLAVSKRGESDYHDNFVDQLTQVSEKYNQRLALLSQLEKHLVQARARALADDEKSLTSITKLWPTCTELSLPRGPSQFRKHLDEELLSRHKLLVPSQYLPSQPEHHKPPHETPPLHLNLTITASNHAHKRPSVSTDTMAAKQTLQQQSSNPIWRNTLSLEERELEKVGLINFNRKANYLRNSRYSKTKWSNTASSGPVRMRQSGQSYPKESMSFVAEPEEVQFTDYSVGETYEATLELTNISAVSRQLRLVPLKSAFFKLTPSACPTADGVVAPGLRASYTISFTPDSLANYQTDLKFTTCNDEEVVIQLTGFRPPPILNIPDVLESGYCLAGGMKTTLLECVNTGGEGTFSVYKPDNTPNQQQDTATSKLVLGPFTISPAQFYLPANDGVIPLSIAFAPDNGVGEYSQQFNISCDNGTVMVFTVRGVAECLSVCCVCVGGEVLPPELELAADASETVANPTINFATVNPYNESTGTIFIQNFSNVELAYHWRFYRPMTEGPPWKRAQGDTPLINQLVPSDNTPFSVYPYSGSFVAKETKKFTFHFTPHKVASYVDMAYLVITGIDSNEALVSSDEEFDWLRVSLSDVAMLCIQLSAVAKEFHVEMFPPALLIPYKLPLATETKKQVKFSNHSLAAICYQWSKYECETVTVTVDPPHGRIEPGEKEDLQVCICSTKEGSFSFNLFCQLENCDKVVSLPISGKVEGPIVSVSVPCLDFGLVPVGRTRSVALRVTSHTNCTLNYALRQLSEEEVQDHFINVPCLSFSPYEGYLVPNGSATISVECGSPGVIGKLKTIVQVLINGKPAQHFWALATLQRPQVSMLPSQLHMDKCYVGIEVVGEVVLANDSPVPAQFTWSSQVAGEGVRVVLSPVTGRIGPYQTITVNIQTTWTKMNPQAEAILRCEILDMDKPIFLLLSAQVLGLSVSYSQPLHMDFGPSNKLGVPVSRTLTVTNTSGIPSALDTQVIVYPSATPIPPVQPKPDDSGRKNSRGRALLGRTVEKSSKQATSENYNLLLRGGHGCCFTVDPSSTSLPPFTSVTLTVTAHSDMWGEYTDQLLCKVRGLSDTVIPVHYGAVGCPIVFLSTATAGCTLTRFGSHAVGANSVRRVLKIKNNSPVDIRVDWNMFNIVHNDNKYVDLIMPIGEAFPKVNDLLGDTHEPTVSRPLSQACASEPTVSRPLSQACASEPTVSRPLSQACASEPTVSRPLSQACDTGRISRSEGSLLQSEKKNVVFHDLVSYSESRLDNASLAEGVPLSNKQLITVFIKPHEGVRSATPFDIHPKQMVLLAHGVSTVEVTFEPSVEAFNQMGPWLASYALGYLSLDNEWPSSVTRKSVHHVIPLRIDIMAALEQVRLSLQCDEDDGLNLSYPASILLQDGTVADERKLTHHFTLLNSTLTVAEFKLATLTSKFTVSNICLKNDVALDINQVITLKPQKSISFDISFTVCSEDLQQSTNEDNCTLVDSLKILYSTGALQEFPLTSTLALPRLALSTHRLEFSTTHIDSRPSMATAVLSNTSMSDALWNLEISSDLQEVLTVCPMSGVLPLHLTGGSISTDLIRIEFSPRRECSYTGTVHLSEVLTGREMVVTVSGQGSADEKYIPTH